MFCYQFLIFKTKLSCYNIKMWVNLPNEWIPILTLLAFKSCIIYQSFLIRCKVKSITVHYLIHVLVYEFKGMKWLLQHFSLGMDWMTDLLIYDHCLINICLLINMQQCLFFLHLFSFKLSLLKSFHIWT